MKCTFCPREFEPVKHQHKGFCSRYCRAMWVRRGKPLNFGGSQSNLDAAERRAPPASRRETNQEGNQP